MFPLILQKSSTTTDTKLKNIKNVSLAQWQGKQFHVSPCHCFPPPLKPQLRQCPECHMIGYHGERETLFYISNNWTHLCLCAYLSTRRAAQTLYRLRSLSPSPLPPTHVHTSLLIIFLYTSLVRTFFLSLVLPLTAEVASVHHNVATASCGELCAILSNVSDSVKDIHSLFC